MQALGHIGPINLIRGGDWRLGRQRLRWRVIRLCRCLAADKVGVQRDTEHRGITALPGSAEVNRVCQLVNGADVDGRVLLDVVIEWLVFIIVAFVLEFQTEGCPRRLIRHTAKQRRGSFEVGIRIHIARPGNCSRALRTVVKLVPKHGKRVSEISAIADVAPSNTEAEIKVSSALIRNEVFAGEQSGTANVPKAQSNFWQPMGFFQEPGFSIDSLVLEALVATQ
ncbi:hypothetical protein D3C85_762670 [compost metagenome]